MVFKKHIFHIRVAPLIKNCLVPEKARTFLASTKCTHISLFSKLTHFAFGSFLPVKDTKPHPKDRHFKWRTKLLRHTHITYTHLHAYNFSFG